MYVHYWGENIDLSERPNLTETLHFQFLLSYYLHYWGENIDLSERPHVVKLLSEQVTKFFSKQKSHTKRQLPTFIQYKWHSLPIFLTLPFFFCINSACRRNVLRLSCWNQPLHDSPIRHPSTSSSLSCFTYATHPRLPPPPARPPPPSSSCTILRPFLPQLQLGPRSVQPRTARALSLSLAEIFKKSQT